MAYQNVGTPRFFIDNYQYLRAIGLDPEAYMEDDLPHAWGDDLFNQSSPYKTIFENPDAFTLDPTQSKAFINTEDSSYMQWFIPMGIQVKNMDFSGNMKWYCAILNHDIAYNINSIGFYVSPDETSSEDDNSWTNILNGSPQMLNQKGTSIFYTDEQPASYSSQSYQRRYTGFIIYDVDTLITEANIGAISMGVMYTMPNSADLDLTMAIENDGYKSITTSGGSTLTNIRYTGAPNWTNGGQFINPFGVGDYSDNSYLDGAKRNGRRSWNLKFSYMSDKDLFASNYMSNTYLESDGNTSGYSANDDLNTAGDEFEYNIFTDDSFVAQVWNKTLGGALPFIFQPDSNNNQADQFCLAQFDMDTLKVSQVAFQTYDISVKIVEIW